MTSPMNTRRGRPRSVDRQKAIDAAIRMYWSDGLFAHSLNKTCTIVGLSKPSLYREFDSEDGLMEAALEGYRDRVVTPLLELLSADSPLTTTLDRAVMLITAPSEDPSGCLFTMMRLAAKRLGPRTLTLVREIERARLDAFEALFRQALTRGDANPALLPELATEYLDIQLTSLLVQLGAGASPDRARVHARLALDLLTAVTGPEGLSTNR